MFAYRVLVLIIDMLYKKIPRISYILNTTWRTLFILSEGSTKKKLGIFWAGGGVLQMKCSDQVLKKAKQQKPVRLAKDQPSFCSLLERLGP